MKGRHLKIIINMLFLRYDFRELLAFSFFLTLRKSMFKPIYGLFFFVALLFYSLFLKTLEIDYKRNIFVTHEKRRFLFLNLDKICQNILILDQARLARSRSKYKAISYNLNTASAKSLVIKELSFDQIKTNVMKVIFANAGTPYIDGVFYDTDSFISLKFFEIDQKDTLGISIYDEEENLIATSIGFFTEDIFNIEFLVSVYGKNSQVARWVLHEAIVDLVHARGYKYIRISHYFSTSIKNIYFNRRLGYIDYNLIKIR